jgi:hypothetical protein
MLLALSFALGWQAQAAQAASAEHLPGLPVVFEPNRGQAPPMAHDIARTADGEVLLMPAGLQFIKVGRDRASFHMRWSGSEVPDIREESATGGVANYYHGLDPSAWISQVPLFRQVRYGGIYPGIDLVFHGSASRLEYDFELKPGAHPERIKVDFDKGATLTIQSDGSLLVGGGEGSLHLLAPTASQRDGSDFHAVPVSFKKLGRTTVGFGVGPYDQAKDLVIDPVVSYTNSLDVSNSTQVAAIAVDGSGDLIMTGSTFAANYTVVNGLPSEANPSEQSGGNQARSHRAEHCLLDLPSGRWFQHRERDRRGWQRQRIPDGNHWRI